MSEPSNSRAPLLLLDREDYSAEILLRDLKLRGYHNVRRLATADQLPAFLGQHDPLVVIFNVHYQQQNALADCLAIKSLAPEAALLALASAGPAIKMVRNWSRQSHAIDVVVEKPLSDERFFLVLEDLVRSRQKSRDLGTQARRIASLLPDGAISAMNSQRSGDAEMFQAAVLFTDIRRSTEAITRYSPQEFFDLLNRSLSAQSAEVTTYEGAVIKYTGDGVFALFRGMGHSYLALRCAIALAKSDSQQILPFGLGVAEGLVLAGLLGDSNKAGLRRQYDVIGATVHLAARLCGMAKPGEVITTNQLHRAAKIPGVAARLIGPVSIRGFEAGVDCVAYDEFSTDYLPKTLL